MSQFSNSSRFSEWPPAARVAVLIFAIHVTLQFFPPIPPVTRGSLVSHALAFAFLIAAGIAVAQARARILDGWDRAGAATRVGRAAGVAGLLGLVGAFIYTAAPELFVRFSAEEGVWEPLGTLCYLTAAILLYKTAKQNEQRRVRRHLFFMAALFAFLFLEEINYLELIGGILPDIGGEYVGAARNVIDLWASGLISPGVAAALTLIAALLAFELWWIELFQPGTIIREMRYPRVLFVQLGLAAIAVAIGIEIRAIEWREGVQKPEELIEAVGAIFLLAFGLDVAAGWRRQSASTNRIDKSTA